MEILYASGRLKKLCEQQKIATQQLGPSCARKLRTRLSDLEAASSVGALKAGSPHPLTGSRKGEFALNLADGDRLVFCSANEPIPVTPDGSIDWHAVTIVKIIFIGDYHA